MTDLVEQHVPTPLGRLRVQVGGEGPVMLFWPSLLMTGDLWLGQAAHFSATHRVVLVDPPGHGGSEPLTAPFTFAACADTIAAVLDALGAESADVVGNSWGGMVGATFAATHPDRVRHAVLMNATASPAGRRQRLEFGLMLRVARLLGGIRPPLTSRALAAFLGPTTMRERPTVVAAVRRSIESVDITSGAWAVRSVVPDRPDQRALLASITAPTLVVAGRDDATFPVAETRAMAQAIPGARFEVLDGVAHLAALEDPARVNALVDQFVRD
ncbi:3-oxoadipate enol-lactonase [Nocardioides aromaticivorans]|uniref:3-oxoadipate enol-lactonase n=1 Tax=Nocardioides aromaticivorans TaxID=200618 RepID=A0A7Y9ZG96_9ACTN|nr:alpha/beta fold hydrolase [Nocardioides aromaticivorans]NYI44270.1 3-oxoadipate enol-lactonase [Nocardioides aromaticivorans]